MQPNCLLAGLFDITGRFKGDRWDYRGVIDYRFSDQFLAYASISTGFKGGGVNPRPFVADQALPFNPETLTTYEAGFKSDFLDRRVRLNGAVFLNKYNDIILGKTICVRSSLPNPCLRPASIGAATVKGAELEASVYPIEGLSFDGSISFLDFKYTSPSLGGFLIAAEDEDGNPVAGAIPVSGITPYTPELSYAIGGQYDYETEAGTFSFRLDGSYQGKLYTNAENSSWSKIPGRFLANGRIAWTTNNEDWRVAFEVQNLFDKYYFMSVSDVTTSLGAGHGRARAAAHLVGVGRTQVLISLLARMKGRGSSGPRPFPFRRSRRGKRNARRGGPYRYRKSRRRQSALSRSRISLPGLK